MDGSSVTTLAEAIFARIEQDAKAIRTLQECLADVRATANEILAEHSCPPPPHEHDFRFLRDNRVERMNWMHGEWAIFYCVRCCETRKVTVP